MNHPSPKPKLAKILKTKQKPSPSASKATALNLLNRNSGRTSNSNRISRPQSSSSRSKRSNCIGTRNSTWTFEAGGGCSSNVSQKAKATRSDSTKTDRAKKTTGDDNTYNRLMLSLLSPFPNEHELALHTCLAFSTGRSGNGKKKTTAADEVNLLRRNPAILNMLLAHVGFYHDCGLRAVMEEMFREALGVNFALFWEELCANNGGLQGLLCECYPGELGKLSEVEKGILNGFCGKKETFQELKCCNGCNAVAELDAMISSSTTRLPMSLRMPENSEKLEKRVNLVGTILRNFSFQWDNATVLAKNSTMLRFLLVSTQVEHGTLPNTAFDIVSNIAKFVGGPTDNIAKQEDYRRLVLALANLMKTAVLNSGDRYKIIRALEAVGGFAMSKDEQVVLSVTDLTVCTRVFQLLTVKQDISLVIAGLECLLAISESGREACDLIAEVRGSIQTLISYMTLDFSEAEAASDRPLAKIQVVKEASESKSEAVQLHAKRIRSSQLTPSSKPEEDPPSQGNVMLVDDNMNCLDTTEKSHGEKGLENTNLSPVAAAKERLKNNSRHIVKGIKVFKIKLNGQISMITLAYDTKAGKYFRPDVYPYGCEWEDCQKRTKTKDGLRWHVYQTHCSENLQDKSNCQWALQSQNENSACALLRGRLSLIAHLENYHCNDDALEVAIESQKNGMMKPSSSLPLPLHTGGNDAPADPDLHKDEERTVATSPSPVPLPPAPSSQIGQEGDEHVITKSTRITAALTLRNLAKHSNNARRLLTRYESHLAELSVNDWDCADVVAQVLHYVGLGLGNNAKGIFKNDC